MAIMNALGYTIKYKNKFGVKPEDDEEEDLLSNFNHLHISANNDMNEGNLTINEANQLQQPLPEFGVVNVKPTNTKNKDYEPNSSRCLCEFISPSAVFKSRHLLAL